MDNDVQLYYEPISKWKENVINSEMTETQLAFLCGLIRKRKPKKIVEVGVAHGGTTCAVLSCLSLLNYDVEFHSVDLLQQCYRMQQYRTGYMVDEWFHDLPTNIKHQWHLGDVLPAYLDDIGKDIDFLILDTVHALPGEILDFLVAFPSLSTKAVVVLHDLILNQIGQNKYAYATKLLYDVVKADKILAKGVDPDMICPGIGGFSINEMTHQSLLDVASSLTISWEYMPEDDMLQKYMEVIKKKYDTSIYDMCMKAVLLNRQRMDRMLSKNRKHTLIHFHQMLNMDKKIVLYGAGEYARKISSYLNVCGKEVSAYVVSDNQEEFPDKKTYNLSKLPYERNECNVIMALAESKHEEILNSLDLFNDIFPLETDDYQILMQYIEDFSIVYQQNIYTFIN